MFDSLLVCSVRRRRKRIWERMTPSMTIPGQKEEKNRRHLIKRSHYTLLEKKKEVLGLRWGLGVFLELLKMQKRT